MTPAEKYFAALKEQDEALEAHRAALQNGECNTTQQPAWEAYKIAFNKMCVARMEWDGYTQYLKAMGELKK